MFTVRTEWDTGETLEGIGGIRLEVTRPNVHTDVVMKKLRTEFRQYTNGKFELDEHDLFWTEYCFCFVNQEWLELIFLVIGFAFHFDNLIDEHIHDANKECSLWIEKYIPNKHSDGNSKLDMLYNFIIDRYWPLYNGVIRANIEEFCCGIYEFHKEGGLIDRYKKGTVKMSKEQYTETRYFDVGTLFIYNIMTHAVGIVLPDEIIKRKKELERFQFICTWQGTLINDLYSLRKEEAVRKPDEHVWNYVYFLSTEYNTTINNAIKLVIEEIRDAVREIEKLADMFKGLGNDGISQYVHYMIAMCKGNHYAHRMIDRYNKGVVSCLKNGKGSDSNLD